MPVEGIKRVKQGFRMKIDDISQAKTEGAVYAILSQGAALAQTMTPIDTSTLINSQYAPQMESSRKGITGSVGYTAAYAAAVHDAPGKLKGQPRAHFGKTREGVEFGGGTETGDYWDPNAEPGFLDKGFEQVKPAIPAILSRHYRV